jgi:hypothetical protein
MGRMRKPNLAAAIRQARKAGVDVSGATIGPDGSVSLTFGQPVKSDGNCDGNPWDEVLTNAPDEKRPS